MLEFEFYFEHSIWISIDEVQKFLCGFCVQLQKTEEKICAYNSVFLFDVVSKLSAVKGEEKRV